METHLIQKTTLSNVAKAYLYKYIRDSYQQGIKKLPPEKEIAERLGVSRVTIRQALAELEKEGYVIRIHGRGTFINPEAIEIQANLLMGEELSSLLTSCGYKSTFEVTDFKTQKAGEECAKALHIDAEDPVYRIEKLYLADGHPATASLDLVPYEIAENGFTMEDLKKVSVFELLEAQTGQHIVRDRLSIEVILKDKIAKSITSAARLENSCLLLFGGINYNQDNVPIMCNQELYDTDYVKLGMLRTWDEAYIREYDSGAH